jgi:hypothetical protein
MLYGITAKESLSVHGKVMIIVSLTALDVGNTLGRRSNHGQHWNQDKWRMG